MPIKTDRYLRDTQTGSKRFIWQRALREDARLLCLANRAYQVNGFSIQELDSHSASMRQLSGTRKSRLSALPVLEHSGRDV